MSTRTCDKCGHAFRDPSTLRRHLANKRPCAPIVDAADLPEGDQAKQHRCRYCGRAFASGVSMCRHVRQSCKIANSEEGMEKLFEHTLQRQIAQLQVQAAAHSAQMTELTSLLRGQLATASQSDGGAPRGVGPAVEHAAVVNTGPTTNIVQQVNQVTQNIIQIVPWDGDRRISVGAEQIVAAFVENARLKEYAGWSDHEMTDPERAPPYVTELLMDLTKRAHADPTARNVYLNPRRADQVLVNTKSGRWEVVPLAEASRLLFDGIAANIYQLTITSAELRKMPMEAQNAVSMARMMYHDEPEEYVARAKVPMAAHLANTTPRQSGRDANGYGRGDKDTDPKALEPR